MLSSERIVVSCKNHKPEKIDSIRNFVFLVVRNYEYEKLVNAEEYTSLKKKVEDDHEGINALTCEESVIREYLTDAVEAATFLSLRKEVNALKDKMKTYGVTIDEYNALSSTDRVFITLQAHTAMPGIRLDSSIVESVDIAPAISRYYATGSLDDKNTKKESLKGIKSLVKPIFHNLVGSEGSLFYGVKLRASDFEAEDLRNFLANFRGNARRTATKKDGGTIYGSYEWTKKDGNKNVQATALTKLFAVVLDRGKDYEVIKPEVE